MLALKFREGSVPLSLEGKTVIFTLKFNRADRDEDAALTYIYTVPPEDVVGAAGEHTIVLQANETQALIPAMYVYQVMVSTPAEPEAVVATYFWGHLPCRIS